MITNFQVYINDSWQNTSPFIESVTLSRKRDSEDIFVVRYAADGTFLFKCDDFDLLIDYVKTREKIRCRFTEEVCGNSEVHDAYLKLDNKADYYKKIITGTVDIIDVYYTLYNGKESNNYTNIDTKITASDDYFSIRKIVNYEGDSGLTKRISYLHNWISKILNNEIDAGIGYPAPSVIQDYYISENYNYKQNFEFEKDIYIEKELIYSLRQLLDYLRDEQFIYWYVRETSLNNTWSMGYIKDYNFTNGDDLTNEENNNEQVIEFLNNSFSKIEYQTFEFKNTSNIRNSYFSDKEVNFLQKSERKISRSLNGETNVQFPDEEAKTDNLLLVKATRTGINDDEMLYSNITKQYEIIQIEGEQQFIEGDWDDLDFYNYSGDDLIFRTKSLWFFDNEQISIRFNLSQSAGVENEDVITVELHYYGKAVGATPLATFKPQFGNNEFNFTIPEVLADQDNWFEVRFVIESWVQNLRMRNFDVRQGFGFVYDIERVTVQSIEVPNYNLSIYKALKNDGANLPYESGIVETNNVEETFTFERQNTFTQNLKYRYDDLISTFNFDELRRTSQGWLRLDEVRIQHSNNSHKFAELTLSGN